MVTKNDKKKCEDIMDFYIITRISWSFIRHHPIPTIPIKCIIITKYKYAEIVLDLIKYEDLQAWRHSKWERLIDSLQK